MGHQVTDAYTHDQMSEIASALRNGFGGEAQVDFQGWDTIICRIDGIDDPIRVSRFSGFEFPDEVPVEIIAGIRLDVQAILANSDNSDGA